MILLRLLSLDNHTDSIRVMGMFEMLMGSKSVVENSNAVSFLGAKP